MKDITVTVTPSDFQTIIDALNEERNYRRDHDRIASADAIDQLVGNLLLVRAQAKEA